MPKKVSTHTGTDCKRRTVYTLKLDTERLDALGERLDSDPSGLWKHYDVAYSVFAFKGEGVNVVGYHTGKVVVSGKNTEDFVENILEAEITKEARLGYDHVHHPEWFTLHAGCDESGKGDLFGPLVAACVVADGDMVKYWMEAGVADSKQLSDTNILKLNKLIRDTDGVVIKSAFARMPKYNDLYIKFGKNLNKLLAWYHGRALNEALDARPAPWGLLDQFTNQPLVDAYVRERNDFRLESRTKAESDPVVAAASIVARAIYVREMQRLSEAAGQTLLKGAGANVLKQAKAIVNEQGTEALANFAKMHFKTAYQALGLEPPTRSPWRKSGS